MNNPPGPDAGHAAGEPLARRLGCYVLPGGVPDSRPAVTEARAAEALGLGAVWIGERYDTKDLPSLAGALSQVTEKVLIGAAVTSPGLRHPMVFASMGQTLQSLSGGRFRLGLGRSAEWRWRAYGVAAPTLASLGDIAGILRRLWAGETVDYRGPLGTFPDLRLPQRPEVGPPPLLLAAVGPKTVALGGEAYDGVILHPFLTPQAVERAATLARDACGRSGRDPDAFRVCATVVVAPEATADQQRRAVGARAAGYFQVEGLGDALVRANGWDPAELARYRSRPELVALAGRPADKALSRDALADLAERLPEGWLSSSSAVGDASVCRTRLAEYIDAGADELILHGTTAGGLGPLVEA
jgi:5,10-methylenetetrahydromethanopterin reductase